MRGRAWGVALAWLVVLAAGWESSARAQDPPPSPPAATPPAQQADSVPPDIVKLKNGSLYRGVVMELVAGDHVDLRLPSGETKRFPMTDVEYAGPPASAPTGAPVAPLPPPAPAPSPQAAPRPLVTIDAKAAKVHFEASSADTDFHIRNEDAVGSTTGGGWSWGGGYLFGSTTVARGYLHICATPCDATLPVGKHRLALSQEGKKPVEADKPIEIDGPSVVRGNYVSRAGTRAAGWVVFGVSLAAGLGLVIAGAANTSQDCGSDTFSGATTNTFCTPQANTGLITAGTAVAIIGPLVSLALILQHDYADITVEPE